MREQFWSKEELSSFCLEFSMLLKAGMSAGEGFLILSENEKNGKKKAILFSLYEETVVGTSVNEAMEKTKLFPPYMMRMLEIGETTGHLEEVFSSLSKYYDERIRMAKLIKEVVAFPIILFFMMLAVTVLLIMKVLPIFESVFAQLGGTLPSIALFFLRIGEGLYTNRLIFLALFLLIIVFAAVVFISDKARDGWNHFWRKRFSTSKMGKLSAMSQFASSLYMTVSGGLDTDRSLEMARMFCEDSILAAPIDHCRQKMQDGMPFAEAVESEELLKPMYCRMLTIGVKTGSLDTSLAEIARRTEEEAASSLQKAAAAVEPVVVIGLSVVVGLLLLSVMFPLIGIMSSLG